MAAIRATHLKTGLSTSQIGSMFNELRMEGFSGVTVQPAALERAEQQYLRAAGGANNVASRFDTAHRTNEETDPASDYAFCVLLERAEKYAEAVTTEVRDRSSQIGYTEEEGHNMWAKAYAEAASQTEGGNHSESREDVTLHNFRSMMRSPTREQVARFQDWDQVTINREAMAVSYDKGHLRIQESDGIIRRHKDVPEEMWKQLTTATPRTRKEVYYTLAADPSYRYETREEAEAEDTLNRCINCGQFRSRFQHDCPRMAYRRQLLREYNGDSLAVNSVLLAEMKKPSDATKFTASNATHNMPGLTPPVGAVEKIQDGERFHYDDPAYLNAAMDDADANFSQAQHWFLHERGTVTLRGSYGNNIRYLHIDDDHTPEDILKNATNAYGIFPDLERVRRFVKEAEAANKTPRFILEQPKDGRFPEVQSLYVEEDVTASRDRYSDTIQLLRRTHNWVGVTEPEHRPGIPADAVELSREYGHSATSAHMRQLIASGDELEMPNLTATKEALAAGSVVAADIYMLRNGQYALHANGTVFAVDEQTSLSGSLALQMNEAREVKVVGSSLKCQCSEYASNYYCPHVAYLEQSFGPAFTQVSSDIPLSLPGIGEEATAAVRQLRAVRQSVSINKGDDENYGIEILPGRTEYYDAPGDLKQAVSSSYKLLGKLSSIPDGERLDPTSRKALATVLRSGIVDLDTKYETPEIRTPLRAQSTEDLFRSAAVTLPVSTYYYPTVGQGVPYVEGNITFREGSTFNDHEITHHTLKCDCSEYAERYDCEHVRDFISTRAVALLPSTPRYVAGTEELLQQITDESERFSYDLKLHNVRTDMDINLADHNFTDAQREEAAEIHLETLLKKEAEKEAAKQAALKVYEETQQERAAMWANGPEQPLTRNMADFQDSITKLQAKAKRTSLNDVLEMRYENVTDGICAPGDTNRAFGVEIEFELPKKGREKALEAIGQDLYEAGLTKTPHQERYHAASGVWERWSFEVDATVDGEIVSPLMRDTPEDWQELEKVIEIVNRHGGKATNKAGSHVHISTGSYRNSRAKHAELVKIVTDNEDTLYRVASNPHRGTHRGTHWCRGDLQPEQSSIIESSEYGEDTAKAYQGYGGSGHTSLVNFDASAVNEHERAHVEFRMWDGSLNAAVIQQQVAISAALTDLAERNVGAESGYYPGPRKAGAELGTLKKTGFNGVTKRQSRADFNETHQGVAELFDSLFRKKEDRDRAVALFAVTKNQGAGKNSDDTDGGNWLTRLLRM